MRRGRPTAITLPLNRSQLSIGLAIYAAAAVAVIDGLRAAF